MIVRDEVVRWPNLNTVLMVEDFLLESRAEPMSFNDLRKKLPRQVMASTLNVILEYLWRSGKVVYGPRGVQWIFVEPEHLKMMMGDSLEV